MPRIDAVDPKTATGAAKQLLDAVQAQLGITPNFLRVLANSPKALEGFLGLYGAAGGFSIDKATQERIALAVAESNACQYCVSAHTAIGRHSGLTNDEIQLNRRGTSGDAKAAAAVAFAIDRAGGLALFAGGKSMGGRMTSLAAAKEPLDGVRGLIYFGFPLHAAGKPSADRGHHLFDIKLPMLFLQGSRDALADLKMLKPLCARLGERVELFVIEGGDHSFHLLKSAGRSDDQALEEAALKVGSWISRVLK